MQACLTSDDISPEEAVARAKAAPPMAGSDFVKEVTPESAFNWDPDDKLSCEWTIVKGDGSAVEVRDGSECFKKLPPIKHSIVAYDFGMKRNILRRLSAYGCDVRVYPAFTPASELLATDPDGVFLSNGPGDPAPLTYAIDNARTVAESGVPTFGICLGHQVLGLALDGSTYKLKFGHRGGNHPVKHLSTGKIEITSQNHGFAVDASSLPSHVEVTHRNLYDGTVEGLRHKTKPVFSVQYHPEASPGPHDADYLFQDFIGLIEEVRR
jgi:carbamoyl-phosphate synthase small subunit